MLVLSAFHLESLHPMSNAFLASFRSYVQHETEMAYKFVLHYHPGIPGRGEYIRLAFESVSHTYSEENKPLSLVMKKASPPHFAPPLLEVQDDDDKSSSFISQTPAILAFLAPILHLDGISKEEELSTSAASLRRAQVNQLTLTVLDLNNEVHDVHHPIASAAYYEDQKEEALKRAKDLRRLRIPKFFLLFQLALSSNSASKQWLIGSSFSTADLALFQVSTSSGISSLRTS